MPEFVEIRLHGRGGQGAWTATNLLAMAALREGKYSQSFPFFGPERGGAPILAFARISDKPIDIHCMVYNPDIVAVLDPTLLGPKVVEGIKDETVMVVNTQDPPSKVREVLGTSRGKLWTVNATRLALEVIGRPITNTAMLGAILKATNVVSLDSLLAVTRERFGGEMGEKNASLIRKAYEEAVPE
ncbi:MAG TPA: pyruvate synthase subunit porC [Candidatus Bathyarchaeota archaeon]|nr:pyruvate synthase subunit porC [Candidatus Bathyarchaeota archaeon]